MVGVEDDGFFVDKYKVSRDLVTPPSDWAAEARLPGTTTTIGAAGMLMFTAKSTS